MILFFYLFCVKDEATQKMISSWNYLPLFQPIYNKILKGPKRRTQVIKSIWSGPTSNFEGGLNLNTIISFFQQRNRVADM